MVTSSRRPLAARCRAQCFDLLAALRRLLRSRRSRFGPATSERPPLPREIENRTSRVVVPAPSMPNSRPRDTSNFGRLRSKPSSNSGHFRPLGDPARPQGVAGRGPQSGATPPRSPAVNPKEVITLAKEHSARRRPTSMAGSRSPPSSLGHASPYRSRGLLGRRTQPTRIETFSSGPHAPAVTFVRWRRPLASNCAARH